MILKIFFIVFHLVYIFMFLISNINFSFVILTRAKDNTWKIPVSNYDYTQKVLNKNRTYHNGSPILVLFIQVQ